MGRLDWQNGRFTVNYEVNEIHGALYGWQDHVGTTAQYWKYQRSLTQVDTIYDESYGQGLFFYEPRPIPVLHANHIEGGGEFMEEGFYYTDELHLTVSYEQLRRVGLSKLEIRTQQYVHDRVVYDDKVFRFEFIQILGQVKTRDIIVAIDCTMVKPDEMVNDPQFAKWVNEAATEEH